MHHRTVERLAAADSPIHRLDPRVKVAALLLFVVGLALLPSPPFWFCPPLFLVVLAGLAAARLPWGFVLGRTARVLPFVGLLAVFLPFTRGTTVLADWPGVGIQVYREGLLLGAAMLIKGALAILAVGWLVFTTPFTRLLLALRSLRVPRVIVTVLSFLFRYLDLLADESLRVRRARRLRCPGRQVRWLGRSTGGMVGRILLRTLDRAERVHRAMLARRFDGEIRSVRGLSLRSIDGVFLVGAVVLGAAAFLAGRWLESSLGGS